MSRIGKNPIAIPEKTEISVSEGVLTVKGPKGELVRSMHPEVSATIADGEVTITPASTSLLATALWGTYASHVRNMIHGVNTPFEKKLVLEGVGYRVELSGTTLKLSVGFSHPVSMEVPEGLTVTVEKNVITIAGADKEQVGQFAATLRAVRKPEPYKGKGIRYEDEVVKRKQGKKTVG